MYNEQPSLHISAGLRRCAKICKENGGMDTRKPLHVLSIRCCSATTHGRDVFGLENASVKAVNALMGTVENYKDLR